MRMISLACCLLIGSVSGHATPKQFSNELALALQKAGWTNPTRLYESPAIRVIAATKLGKRYVLYATPDGAAMFDVLAGAEVPAGYTVTATESTAYGKLTGLAAIDLTYDQKRANNGSDRDTKTVFVRSATATVACVIEARATTDAGTKCGSSSWRSVSVRAVAGAQPTFDVTLSQSGSFSQPVPPNGVCRASSPVRPRPVVTRVAIPTRGMCTRGPVPTGTPKPTDLME